MTEFVHLHLHTQYSVLDGAIKINECIAKAKSYGQRAVAMTDHGVMHGAIEFYKTAKEAGIKPIIGCELYVSPTNRFDKTSRNQGGPRIHHLTVLAKDHVGYTNLCKLVSLGYIEGFYSKPRVDLELLERYNKGLIVLSGCLAGEFSAYAQDDNEQGAKDFLQRYAKIFGERYFLEIQPHDLSEQRKLNSMARHFGKELGIPLVATNDCHYLNTDDHYAQEVLMCISTGKLITDETRIKHTIQLDFKTGEQMLKCLPGEEEAIRNSLMIANMCSLDFDFSTYHMPHFEPPKEKTLDELFKEEAKQGLERRFVELEQQGIKFNPPEYHERLNEEIQLIIQMGFVGYFLVVADFINWAKKNDIPVGPGRGSAAGSLVAYAMSITELDPIFHKLLFERFLNPERISLPDIDIDFCINGRSRVIEYVTQKYGKDKVAQICTFGTLKAKAAIKDVGRVLGLSYAETDRIAKLIPAPRQGFDYPLKEAIEMEKRLKDFAEGEGSELISLALKLEGLSRHTSTHAAGIVIADKPLVDYMPLMVDKEDQIVTQYSMNYVEKIGLVKFDFLGLKTLTVIHEAVRMIKQGTGETLNLNILPLTDVASYKLIASGRTIGIFQLESSGITDMVIRMKPNSFDDIVALLALYRPGPLDSGMAEHYINRKHGREPVKHIHPILEPILSDTYGIILYQEQIMQIARDLAGYSLGEADLLRRAMGKKKPEEMAKQREKFVEGSKARGVADAIAQEIFNQMETFARYGFNRSHSAAYALISYQTAYLKAHYPTYFMAALMTFEMSDTDKTLKNINECREMGLSVLPPDVNQGEIGFSVVEKKIIFGLAALKGIGEKAVSKIAENRSVKGKFSGLLDFCVRMDQQVLNHRLLESLIKSGAFDWTAFPRAELIGRLDDILKLATRERERGNSNQLSFFDKSGALSEADYKPNRKLLPEWPVNIKLANEREALGFYLSGHPLEKFRSELENFGSIVIEKLRTLSDGAQITTAGVITLLKLKNTKKGDRYATFVLEDMLDTIEIIVWPDTYQKVHAVLQSEDPILVTGRVDVSDERRIVVASEITSAIQIRDNRAKEAWLVLETTKGSLEKLDKLREVFGKYRGECPVKLIVRNPRHSDTVLSLKDRVAPSELLSNSIEELFGEPVLKFR